MIIDFIYFDSNSIRLANGDAHYVFYSYMDTSTVVMQTKFRRTSIKYPLRNSLLNDRTTWMNISRSTISDAPHFIGPAWKTVPVSLNSSGPIVFRWHSASFPDWKGQQYSISGADRSCAAGEGVAGKTSAPMNSTSLALSGRGGKPTLNGRMAPRLVEKAQHSILV